MFTLLTESAGFCTESEHEFASLESMANALTGVDIAYWVPRGASRDGGILMFGKET